MTAIFRSLSVAIAALAVAGLWQIVTVESRPGTVLVGAPGLMAAGAGGGTDTSSVPSSASPSAASPDPGAGGSPSTTPAVGAPIRAEQTAGPAATGSGAIRAAVTDPVTLTPPAPGRYVFSWTVDGQESTQAMNVNWIGGAPGAPVVSVTGTPVGPGIGQTQQWSGRNEAILSSSQGQTACAWHAPLLEYAEPIAVGEQWTTSGSCQEVPVPGRPDVQATLEESDRVTGRTVTTVHGRSMVAWVFQRSRTFTQSSGGQTATSVSVTSDLFAPAIGLVLLEVSRTEYPRPDGTTAELTSVARLVSG